MATSSNKGNGNGEEQIIKTLEGVFQCLICMENSVDPHLCPHCSKLYCYACLKKWLTKERPECPHCSSALHLRELVKCRWVKEVTEQIKTVQQANLVSQIKNSKDRCQSHQEELTVYCWTCLRCICNQCALCHTGHSFKPLEEVYQLHVAQIKNELFNLNSRLVTLMSLVPDMERNVKSLRAAKNESVREIRNAVKLMISRLDTALKAKLLTIMDQKKGLSQETKQKNNLIKKIEHQLHSSHSKSELIAKSSELSKMIHQALKKPMASFATAPIPANFHSEIVPSFDSSTFPLSSFTRVQQTAAPVYSAPLHVHGLCWRLKVYPDGNCGVRGKYLSVFLELSAGLPETSTYEYRVEMLHQVSRDPSKNKVKGAASDFEVGTCKGYNHFFRLDLLVSEGYLNPDSDTLIFRFHVRPPTFYQRCRDQQWYIDQLITKQNQQIPQINDLVEDGDHKSHKRSRDDRFENEHSSKVTEDDDESEEEDDADAESEEESEDDPKVSDVTDGSGDSDGGKEDEESETDWSDLERKAAEEYKKNRTYDRPTTDLLIKKNLFSIRSRYHKSNGKSNGDHKSHKRSRDDSREHERSSKKHKK